MSLTGANLQSHKESREFKDSTAGTLLSHMAGTSLKSSEAHAAIDLVLSSFASVATNTTFSGPDVKITDVHELLRQPDAHKFMECGGLLSRIARHYAPGLFVRAFNGPPLDRRGTELNTDGTHYANRIGQAEIQTLMGLTTNSSLWPHPVLYENSDKYNGEWTVANEIWFLKHANRIQGCMAGTLRSGRDWQKAIRGHTDEQIASPTVIGTVAHASAVCEKLVMEYPEFWDGFDSMPFVS
ncbi:hypothetical protein PILCRDRAFT_13227 [Piloderma croceum F 1598]|uniref:Uncharacterized protein n=1 Tax=Piloderma croceum (strain F 1598) TaxID=765440 RepID=A0A0C3F7K7_PILCF|nr:hypothetical protein PILCRDRAFT_13227 [Piloderma croceum F 1598]